MSPSSHYSRVSSLKEQTLMTTSLDTAAALAARGYKISYVENGNRNSYVFSFLHKNGIQEDEKKYYNHELLVDALAFSDARRRLKSMLFAIKEGQNY